MGLLWSRAQENGRASGKGIWAQSRVREPSRGERERRIDECAANLRIEHPNETA